MTMRSLFRVRTPRDYLHEDLTEISYRSVNDTQTITTVRTTSLKFNNTIRTQIKIIRTRSLDSFTVYIYTDTRYSNGSYSTLAIMEDYKTGNLLTKIMHLYKQLKVKYHSCDI